MFFRFARTIDTIESLKDVIEKTEQYQKDVAEHIKKASEIETIPEVLLKRIENWSSKRIEYFVSVRHIPVSGN